MASDAVWQGVQDQSKAKIFISYSRQDLAFADRLEAALKARGFEPFIDRSKICAFEEWWKRIEALIAGADTVVSVLSLDSVSSEVALKEVAFAASLNKRFVPIVCRRVNTQAVPEALAKLNFIFFDDDASFEQRADQLAEALSVDAAGDRSNTEWQRHLSESYGRIGDVLVTQGKLDQALKAYRGGLAIAERLATADRSNTEWQHDLAFSFHGIGYALNDQGKFDEALQAYRDGLAIDEQFAICQSGARPCTH